MRSSPTTSSVDLYARLAVSPAPAGPDLHSRGTATFTIESVDDDRPTDASSGLPLR